MYVEVPYLHTILYIFYFTHFSEAPTWRGSYEASRVFCTYDVYDCTLKCLNNLLLLWLDCAFASIYLYNFLLKNLNGIIRLFSWRNEKWNNRHAMLNGSDYSQLEFNIYNIQWIYYIILHSFYIERDDDKLKPRPNEPRAQIDK